MTTDPNPDPMDHLKSQAHDLNQRLESDTERILGQLKQNLEKKLEGAQQTPMQLAMLALAVGLIDEFKPVARQAFADLDSKIERGIDATKESKERAKAAISRNGWKLALAAVAAGLVVGLLLNRNKDETEGE